MSTSETPCATDAPRPCVVASRMLGNFLPTVRGREANFHRGVPTVPSPCVFLLSHGSSVLIGTKHMAENQRVCMPGTTAWIRERTSASTQKTVGAILEKAQQRQHRTIFSGKSIARWKTRRAKVIRYEAVPQLGVHFTELMFATAGSQGQCAQHKEALTRRKGQRRYGRWISMSTAR